MWEDMKEIAAIQKDRVETVSFRRQPRKKNHIYMLPCEFSEPRCAHRLVFLTHTGEQLLLPVSGVYESCAALNMVMFAFVPCKDSQGELDCTQMSL